MFAAVVGPFLTENHLSIEKSIVPPSEDDLKLAAQKHKAEPPLLVWWQIELGVSATLGLVIDFSVKTKRHVILFKQDDLYYRKKYKVGAHWVHVDYAYCMLSYSI
jgi:hypothetical protein